MRMSERARSIVLFFTVLLIGLVGLGSRCSLDQPALDFEVAEVPRRLVLSCYLHAGASTVQVRVSESLPTLFTVHPGKVESESGIRKVSGAVVELGDVLTGQWYSLRPVGEEYVLDGGVMRVECGRTYELRVRAQGYEAISARCTIPDDGVVRLGRYERLYKGVEYEVVLPRIPERYFMLSEAFKLDTARELSYIRYLFSTELSDGNSIRILDERRIPVPEEDKGIGKDTQSPPPGMRALVERTTYRLYELDRHAYHYLLSAEQQESFSNPFGQPSMIHTNVKGGLGILGGMVLCDELVEERIFYVPIREER